MSEENAALVTENPVARGAVVSAASNPSIQKVAVNAAVNNANSRDVESQRPAASSESLLGVSPDVLSQMKKLHTIMRVGMILTSLTMAAASVLILMKGASISLGFIAVYVFFFAILLFCFECGLKAISQIISSNFGFLYSGGGRLLFMCVVAGMCFRLGLVGQICMGCIGAIQALYIFTLFKYPKYEEYLRKKHYYAEKNFGM